MFPAAVPAIFVMVHLPVAKLLFEFFKGKIFPSLDFFDGGFDLGPFPGAHLHAGQLFLDKVSNELPDLSGFAETFLFANRIKGHIFLIG
jgi:hypothetical protein